MNRLLHLEVLRFACYCNSVLFPSRQNRVEIGYSKIQTFEIYYLSVFMPIRRNSSASFDYLGRLCHRQIESWVYFVLRYCYWNEACFLQNYLTNLVFPWIMIKYYSWIWCLEKSLFNLICPRNHRSFQDIYHNYCIPSLVHHRLYRISFSHWLLAHIEVGGGSSLAK